MMNAVLHPASRKEMQYKDIMQHPTLGPKYKTVFGNELGRLCKGIRDIQGTNTCFFVELSNIPKDRKFTYGKLVCDNKPNKAEKERVILTVGDDRLDYTGEVATSTADITTFKILINNTLSTEDADMMMMDIKNYYLGTPLPRYDYIQMKKSSPNTTYGEYPWEVGCTWRYVKACTASNKISSWPNNFSSKDWPLRILPDLAQPMIVVT
jgi:hypothetical protein